METTCQYIPNQSTGYFSNIIKDYLNNSQSLQDFYQHPPNMAGLMAAIKARQGVFTNRKLLATVLAEQYQSIHRTPQVQENLNLLLQENTFTVTTAHQPNIFTGPLYFIYKILHAISLANGLKKEFPSMNFVPVYYMGSEDADLAEIGSLQIGGQSYVWNTQQTGAVGRMKVDHDFLQLMKLIEGQLAVLPFGKDLMQTFQEAYQLGTTIQLATFQLVNHLFSKYGLLIVIPDHAALKTLFHQVVKKELLEQFSHQLVNETIGQLGKSYKVQTAGRELNLFYLLDNHRERIEKHAMDGQVAYMVKALNLSFSESEILTELSNHPERFSANVILRGAFQETILPNIAFIGGGGELAYWLELKKVFEAVQIPFPVLVLRNSFLIATDQQVKKIQSMGLTEASLFQSLHLIMNELVTRQATLPLSLTKELTALTALYEKIYQLASNVDQSLRDHVRAIEKKAMIKLLELEKKIIRAEKRKYPEQQNQLSQMKNQLFPNQALQERVENFSMFYAQYGDHWIEEMLKQSSALNQGFGWVTLHHTD